MDLPVDVRVQPVLREIANDGTVLMRLTQPQDPAESNAPGILSLWNPGKDPRPIYSENRVQSPTISANGARVAFESVVEGGADDDRRNLVVLDLVSGEQLTVDAMPWKDRFGRKAPASRQTAECFRRFRPRPRPQTCAFAGPA